MYFELFKSKDGWRVRFRFANHRIFATTEAYSSKSKAVWAAKRVFREIDQYEVYTRVRDPKTGKLGMATHACLL